MVQKYNSLLSNKLIFLKHKQFTGKVTIQDGYATEWILYFNCGRLVWMDGGLHPHRTWKRLIDRYCPQVLKSNLQISIDREFNNSYYCILKVLLERGFLNRETVKEFIKTRASEAIFDLLQSETKKTLEITLETVTEPDFPASNLQTSLPLVVIEDVLIEAKQAWLIWLETGLQKLSPHLAPKIKQQAQLQKELSGVVFQNFLRLLDGQRSLRDLAFWMNKDVRKLTSSLMPYIEHHLLELIAIDDIKFPYINLQNLLAEKQIKQSDKPLIVCIDDSPQICNIMKQIITRSGYRFIGVQQAIQAVPSLIANKPNLVFLDIGMPIMNGYEICSQIRRVSQIKNIPVVILTGNDGIVDRVRAKVVGANAFVSKPIEIEKITQAINDNLQLNSSLNSSSKDVAVKSS